MTFDANNTPDWALIGGSGTITSSGQVSGIPANSSGVFQAVANNGGCTASDNITVYNRTPEAVSVSGGGTYCGSALLTASGGAGGTIYWQGTTAGGTSTALASSSQTVTSSGTYYFRAYNSTYGCWGAQESVSVTITNPTFNSPVSTSICAGESAQLVGNYSNGISPTYQWQIDVGGSWLPVADNVPNVGALYSGSNTQALSIDGLSQTALYRLQINDAGPNCGITNTSAATVTVNSLPDALDSITTSGSGCGSLTLTANSNEITGGGYTSEWFEDANNNGTLEEGIDVSLGSGTTIQATTVGTYDIFARQRNISTGCSGPATALNITIGQTFTNTTTFTDVTCNGGGDGSAAVTSSGCVSVQEVATGPTLNSTPSFSFSGLPNTSSTGATLIFSAVGDLNGTAGNNLEQWDISDENGNLLGSVGAGGYVGAQCNDTLYDTVSVSAAQMAAWNADGVIQFSAIDAAGNINTTLCGQDFLSVTIDFCRQDPVTYAWSNGSTSSSISGLTAGDYTVLVSDTAGCVAAETFTITEPDVVSATLTTSATSCNGSSDGSVTITATGGSGAGYSYAWTPSAGVTTSGNVSSGFSAGSYSLVVTDGNSCASSPITAVIEEPTTPTIVATVGNICSGGQITSAGIDFGISGGTAPYTVFQENGATDIDVTASLPLTSSSSSYSETFYVQDANGCLSSTTTATTPLIGQSASSDVTAYCTNYIYVSPTGSGSAGTPDCPMALDNQVWSLVTTDRNEIVLLAGVYSNVPTLRPQLVIGEWKVDT